MKRKLFFLLLCLLNINGFSKCAYDGISFWPKGKTIRANSILVITGYGGSQHIIDSLNTKYSIYLKTGNKKIKLSVRETLKSEFHLTQAVLVPEEKLIPGLDYKVCIDRLTEHNLLEQWDAGSNTRKPFSWIAVADKTADAPAWISQPSVLKNTFCMFGCGPEVFVHLGFSVRDTSDFLIKTTVTNETTKKSTTYYLSPEKSKTEVLLGHGMCSGAFNLELNGAYEASFSLMDITGRSTAQATPNIQFKAPGKGDRPGGE
ncbi:MAG: hypothetical protein ACHQRM_00040 [Bacteroidia bacterium]